MHADPTSGVIKELLEMAMPIGEEMVIEKADRLEDDPPPPPGNTPPGFHYYVDAAVLRVPDLFNREMDKRYQLVNVEDRSCSRCRMKGHTPGFCLRTSCFNCDEMGHRADECRFNERVCTYCKSAEHKRGDCPNAPQGPRQHVAWGFNEERPQAVAASKMGIKVTEDMYSRYPTYTGVVDYKQLTSGEEPIAAGLERLQLEPKAKMVPAHRCFCGDVVCRIASDEKNHKLLKRTGYFDDFMKVLAEEKGRQPRKDKDG